MVGTAERTITAHHRAIARELRALARWPRPPYASSSAFRFVYDRSAPRDIADVSAVSQHLGVLIRAVTEQGAHPPTGPEPGTVQRREDVPPPDPLKPVRGPLPSPPPMPPGPGPTAPAQGVTGPGAPSSSSRRVATGSSQAVGGIGW